MLKAILVDDESAILEQLKAIVNWSGLGVEIAGAFLTPGDALTFLETHRVDIIISDISMPVINGIEFAHRVRALDESIKIIFLSAYQDFSYAQAAMRLGSCDYLLKPVSATDIEMSILRVCDGIQEHSQQEAYISQLEQKARMSEVYLRDRFLQSMILTGNMESEAIREQMAHFHISIHSELFQVLLIDSVFGDGDGNLSVYEAALREAVWHALEDLDAILFADLKGRLCLIVERPSLAYSLQYDVEMIASRIRDVLRLDLNLEARIGSSEVCKGVGNLYKGYLEALYALEYGAYTGSNGYNRYGMLSLQEQRSPVDQYALRSSFLFCLRCGNLDEIQRQLTDILRRVERGEISPHYARLLYIDIIITLNIFLQETRLTPAEVFGDNFDPVILLYQMEDLSACVKSVLRYCQIIIERMQGGEHQNMNRLLAQNVAQRIQEELANSELSVRSLAREFYISEDHLNVLFKSVMKTSLKRYIIDRKMEKAHDLLSRGDCSVGYVARETGFLDALYFSKSFKKYFGVAPSEIVREKKQG